MNAGMGAAPCPTVKDLTTSRRVLLVLFGTLLLLGIGLIVWMHQGERRARLQEAASRQTGITATLAGQLDGGRVTRLLSTYADPGLIVRNTQDAWYYSLHDALKRTADAFQGDLDLLLLVPDSAQGLAILVTADEPAFRTAYTGRGRAALLAYLDAGRIDGGMATEEEQLITFSAVRDGRGRIVGLVSGSSGLAAVEHAVRAALYRKVGVLLAVFLIVGLVLFTSVGRWVRHQEAAHSDLQQRHAGITDSIAYAGKIQKALVPDPDRYAEVFADHFVLDRPKDVVSGDFHWFHRTGPDTCFVAAADCTGHGLPGAMMAAIGCSLLNEVAVNRPGNDPAELLAELNRRMLDVLHQEGRKPGAGDGMDVALCRIDRVKRELLFAGAFRPLYWMHDGQLTVINGDRRPIGGSQHEADRRFTVHRIAYHPGDRIYLFSDGYVDQFGGPDGRKFMTGRFNDLLLANQHLPLHDQLDVLDRALADWKGDGEQVDDVCVVGLEV